MIVRQNKKQAKKGNSRWRFQAKLKWILLPLMLCCSGFLGNQFTACCVILTTNEHTKQKTVKSEKNNLPGGGCKRAAFGTGDGTQQYGHYTIITWIHTHWTHDMPQLEQFCSKIEKKTTTYG